MTDTAAEIEPVEGEPTRFWVKSTSRTGVLHMVDMDDDGKPACSCHDHQCRERICKHIRSVQRHIRAVSLTNQLS
jgi:hypothetical protein